MQLSSLTTFILAITVTALATDYPALPSGCYYIKGCHAQPISTYDNTGFTYCHGSQNTDLCMSTNCSPYYACICKTGFCGQRCDHPCHKMFLFGGQSALSNYEVSLEMYDLEESAGNFRRLADMPTGRSFVAGAALGGNVYAIGGSTGSASNLVSVFDPAGNYWTAAAPLTTPRWGHAAAIDEGQIFVVGGYSTIYLNTVEVYKDSKWTTNPQTLSLARRELAVAVISDADGLYAIGGYGSSGVTDRVEKMNFHSGYWANTASLKVARYHHCAAVVGEKIYAIGGYGATYHDTIEEFDKKVDQWSLLSAKMTTARRGCSCAVFNNLIYVVGGYGSSGYLDSVEIFDPASGKWSAGKSHPSIARSYAGIAYI